MNPNDLKTGSVERFLINRDGRLIERQQLFDSLSRPVQATSMDFDNNGTKDYLVAGFGNKEGSLFIMRSDSAAGITINTMLLKPGVV